MRAVESLQNGAVHIHYVFSDELSNPVRLDAYKALLTEEECARYERFRFEKHRHQFLITRALVRTTLSIYAPAEPGAWRFEEGENGKPEIAAPALTLPLRFNLSHTEGLVVCVVALTHDIGIDVEDVWRTGKTLEIANRHFAPAEVAALRDLPAMWQRLRFFEYWTLKEAYVKARGVGISFPLEKFAFQLKPELPVGISFEDTIDDNPEDWTFWQETLQDRYLIALAVRSCEEKRLEIRLLKSQMVT